MSNNTYRKTTGVVFAAIAVLHGLRLIYGWEGLIGGWTVPVELARRCLRRLARLVRVEEVNANRQRPKKGAHSLDSFLAWHKLVYGINE